MTLELKGNGKCVLNVDGDSADGKWSYEDGVLAVSGGGIDCTGAIENGVLSLTNLMDMGIDLTFEKEGGAPSGNSGLRRNGWSAGGQYRKQRRGRAEETVERNLVWLPIRK